MEKSWRRILRTVTSERCSDFCGNKLSEGVEYAKHLKVSYCLFYYLAFVCLFTENDRRCSISFFLQKRRNSSRKKGGEKRSEKTEKERERERKRNKKRTSGRCIERGRFNFSGHIFLPLFLYIPASPSRNLNEVDIMPLRVSTDRLAPFIFIRGHTPRTVQPLPRFWFSFEFSTVIRIFY